MKKSIRLLTAGLLTLIALSCQQKEINDDSGKMQGNAYATYKINITGEESTNATKSLLTVDEDDVKSINLYAFDPQTGDILLYGGNAGPSLEGTPVKAYISGAITSFEWSLPINQPLDIYAICNINEISTTPGNVDELMSLDEMNYTISDISDLNENGIPMTGIVESFNDDGSGNIITIPVRRIVAKYTLAIKEIFSEFEVLDVRICNVNSRTTLFGENEAATSASSLIAKGDWAGQDDLNDLNQGNQVAFYMLENMQTTANRVNANVSKWYNVHEHFNLNNKGQYCTHLEIYCTNGSKTRTTRLYLGKDCTTNFDVVRNTIKNITIKAVDLIDHITEETTDWISFDNPTSTIDAGETLEAGFLYAFNLNPDRADEIEFRIEPSSAPVTISDYNINNDGTGTVTLQCDASASAQTVTLWGGVEDLATATMEIEVLKAAEITKEYELTIAPQQNLTVGQKITIYGVLNEKTYTDGELTDTKTTQIPASSLASLKITIGSGVFATISSRTGILHALAVGLIRVTGTYSIDGQTITGAAPYAIYPAPKPEDAQLVLEITDFEQVAAKSNYEYDDFWDFGAAGNRFNYDLGIETPEPTLYCFEGNLTNTLKGTKEQWINLYNKMIDYNYDDIALINPSRNTNVYCENTALFSTIAEMINYSQDATIEWLTAGSSTPVTPPEIPTVTTKIWFGNAYLDSDGHEYVVWNSSNYLKHELRAVLSWSNAHSQHFDDGYLYAGDATGTFDLGEPDELEPRNGYAPDQTFFTGAFNANGTIADYTISTDHQTITVKEDGVTYIYIIEF